MLEDEKLAGVPVMIYANKQDLSHAAKASEVRQVPDAFVPAPLDVVVNSPHSV